MMRKSYLQNAPPPISTLLTEGQKCYTQLGYYPLKKMEIALVNLG